MLLLLQLLLLLLHSHIFKVIRQKPKRATVNTILAEVDRLRLCHCKNR